MQIHRCGRGAILAALVADGAVIIQAGVPIGCRWKKGLYAVAQRAEWVGY
jgi:hypothetical protein